MKVEKHEKNQLADKKSKIKSKTKPLCRQRSLYVNLASSVPWSVNLPSSLNWWWGATWDAFLFKFSNKITTVKASFHFFLEFPERLNWVLFAGSWGIFLWGTGSGDLMQSTCHLQNRKQNPGSFFTKAYFLFVLVVLTSASSVLFFHFFHT